MRERKKRDTTHVRMNGGRAWRTGLFARTIRLQQSRHDATQRAAAECRAVCGELCLVPNILRSHGVQLTQAVQQLWRRHSARYRHGTGIGRRQSQQPLRKLQRFGGAVPKCTLGSGQLWRATRRYCRFVSSLRHTDTTACKQSVIICLPLCV
jgi:hypothetical protein